MPTIRLAPSFSLSYIDSGLEYSQTVLLLHGLGSTSDSWVYQMPALQEAGFRVLAPDARGFGKSGFPKEKLTVEKMASDYYALLERLETAPAHVVGLSMGGAAALQFAHSYAHCTRSLVLVNTFAALRPGSLGGWLYFGLRLLLVHTLGLDRQAKFVSRRVFPAPEQELYRQALIEQVRQANPQAYRAAMRALARFNLEARLREISCPTLVITGELDSTIPPKVQKRLAEKITNARHITIPNAGHAVTIDQPEAFNRCLLEFISDIRAGQRKS
jgi:3-oxoadipate enol-lactonase